MRAAIFSAAASRTVTGASFIAIHLLQYAISSLIQQLLCQSYAHRLAPGRQVADRAAQNFGPIRLRHQAAQPELVVLMNGITCNGYLTAAFQPPVHGPLGSDGLGGERGVERL